MIGKIVLATANAGKVREFQQLFGRSGPTIVPQSQFNIVAVAETGLTFVENAILKARHAARYSGLPAIADDSGLEVDCLDGAPGIHSARFAGDNASDAQNNQRLLRLLQDVAEDERTARFQCLLVFLRNDRDPTPIICQGTWQGRLLLAPRGDQGFGYDPLFYLPELGCTAAELPAEEKNRIGHRGQAMAMMLRALGP